jgi:hypothetical protein
MLGTSVLFEDAIPQIKGAFDQCAIKDFEQRVTCGPNPSVVH